MDLFDFFATIKLNAEEYFKGLDDASDHTSRFSENLKTGLATAAKVGAAAITTAGAGIVALTKSSVEHYAEYEQLVGGVETLFETSADTVMAYADNAYKTAGLSANEYMETVTSFSASLLQSLDGDTEKAAEKADQAITDMADNANKMGTSIESIQNAYQGFAKQNFTMLDNLKLGYGGTKEEMQRLLEDAEKLSGQEFDISSYADIVDAIHVVQTEMGITGTTAAEASNTIAGSAAAMKSAWENLVTGLADENANVDVLLDNFLDSVETTAGNVLPVVERVLTSIFKELEENGPEMIKSGANLLGKLAAGALRAIPDIVASIPEIVGAIVEGFEESGPDIEEIGKDIVRGLWEGISSLAGWIGEKVTGFFNGLFDDVKENEDIHSPSRKWAEIGKMDALGFGSGWDSEFETVKRDITNGLDFGTANVDFVSSGLGISSAGIINGLASTGQGQNNTFTAILQLPDGTELARYYLPSFIDVSKSNGTPILNPA